MFCIRCGADNSNEARFCTACSAPLIRPPETTRIDRQQTMPQDWQRSNQPRRAEPLPPPEEPYPGYRSSYRPGAQGYPPTPVSYSDYAAQGAPMQGRASGRAIASMLLSVLSLLTCGPLMSVPGMILGKIEMNSIRRGQSPAAGETFAKIGYYVGVIATLISCLTMLWFFGALFGAFH